jgi:hypothetical protein
MMFGALAVAAAATAIGYVLPAHRLVYVPHSGGWLDLAAQPGEPSFHSLLHDGGGLPLLGLLVVFLTALLVRKRGLGAGMLAGVLAVGGAFLAIVPLILVHLFARYESGIGDLVFGLGLFGTFIGGCVMTVSEPILYVLERRRIERTTRPMKLPRATALA